MSQLGLFELPGEPEFPFDIDAFADHIAANARFEGYDERPSEAARDEGHVPLIELIEETDSAGLSEKDKAMRISEDLKERNRQKGRSF